MGEPTGPSLDLDGPVVCNGEGCCSEEHLGDVIEYRVGDCLPDGAGGCQRSAGKSRTCCSSANNKTEEKCCDEDPGATECCLKPSTSVDKCHEEDKEWHSAQGMHEPAHLKTQATAHNASCCGMAITAASKKGNCDPDPNIDDSNRALASDTPSKSCCTSDKPANSIVRHRFIHSSRSSCDRNTPTRSHKRSHSHSIPHRHSPKSECSAGTTLVRFFEAACCCLVDWRRSQHHHHPKKSDVPSPGGVSYTYPPEHTRAVADASSVEHGGGRTVSMLMTVQGMDCPSCASKVTRALNTMPTLSNVKVNSISGLATFNYVEGAVLSSAISQRASELTGFDCSVPVEDCIRGERKAMRVFLPATSATSWERERLPLSVSIKSSIRLAERIILDVEYNTTSIQPREVLDIFGGTFVPSPKHNETDIAQRELMALLRRTTMSSLLTIPILVFSWAPISPHPIAYGACSLVLSTATQFYIAAPIHSSALRALFLQHVLDMDLLVTLSSSIAYMFSTIAYFMLVGGRPFSDPVFETPALLITLITLGRLISAYARRRATSELHSMRSLQADTVELVDPTNGTMVISSELVHIGDTLLVSPHALVPTDGVVTAGHSSVNEASITGESVPVEKTVGSPLTAGTLNGPGLLHMKVERVPSNNTVSSIGRMLFQIQDERLSVQDLADRVASYLAPVILFTAVIVFAVWMAVNMAARSEPSSKAGVAALQYAISVMIVSCPCALVLCVPMVVVISAAVASKNGVLFKSSQAVQFSKSIAVVVFDKTGTLTTGKLDVAQAHIIRNDAQAITLALVSASRHPVAQSVASFLAGSSTVDLDNVKSLPGRGIEANLSGRLVRGGSPDWLGLASDPIIEGMQSQAMTIFAVVCATELIAVFGLRDTLRPSAGAAVKMLMERGVEAHIVSGDTQLAVSALAQQLGIAHDRASGRCLPETKLERVRALQGTGPHARRVLFVGDGTNDSLALAQADVGVSLGSGTDIALSAADVIVLDTEHGADLARALRVVFGVSSGAVHRIKLNFVWAFVYNVVAVLFAAGAFVNVRLPPQYAALGEMVSVLPVVFVAWSMWLVNW